MTLEINTFDSISLYEIDVVKKDAIIFAPTDLQGIPDYSVGDGCFINLTWSRGVDLPPYTERYYDYMMDVQGYIPIATAVELAQIMDAGTGSYTKTWGAGTPWERELTLATRAIRLAQKYEHDNRGLVNASSGTSMLIEYCYAMDGTPLTDFLVDDGMSTKVKGRKQRYEEVVF